MNDHPVTAVQLTVHVSAGLDSLPEEADQLARDLLRELRDLEVESAELLAGGPLPPGAKSAEAVTVGAVALAVLPAVLPKIVDFMQAWSLRGQGRTVKFKGKVGGQEMEFEGSAEDLKVLLAALSSQPPPASAGAAA